METDRTTATSKIRSQSWTSAWPPISRRVLESHRWPIFMTERIMEVVCRGAALQAVWKRSACEERADAHQAALPVQSLRAELHRHTRPRQAAGPEGCCGAALCQWSVDEPHHQAPGCLDPNHPG